MKRYVLFLLMCWCTLVLQAEPYGLLVNGTTQYEASPLSETDLQGREQFLVSCVTLKVGDKVQLCDFGSDNAVWMSDVEPYGEYQNFTQKTDHVLCNVVYIT